MAKTQRVVMFMLVADIPSLEPLYLTAIACLLAVIVILLLLLRKNLQRVRQLANHDQLTGLANHEAFRKHAEAEKNRSARTARPFTLAFIDCDDFKNVNDSLGHLIGDQVLKTAADVMRSHTRNYDIVARMGGDEFAILFPETSAQEAHAVVERLRSHLSEAMQGYGRPITFSIGVFTFCEPAESVDEMIRVVDDLMYSAKREGKAAVRYSATEDASTQAEISREESR